MSRTLAKILSALLLVLAIIVTQIPVTNAEASDILSSDYETEGNKLLKYTGTAEVVSVPAEIKVIGEEAFAGCDSIVSVEISGNTTEIGYRAFAGCDQLRTIHVGDQVEKIDVAAFSNNPELVNVSLGAQVKELGDGVFAGCKKLEQVTISEDNPYLSYSNGILYGENETIIYALMPAIEKEAYTFPNTVEEVKAYAFWGNPYLERVVVDSNLKNVPAYAFSGCINLKEVEIPLPVRSIEAKAFEDCVNLKSVTLPDSMSSIHETAFDGCNQVTFLATPGTYAGDYAVSRSSSDADQIEYEETDDNTVISDEEAEEEPENGEASQASQEALPTGSPAKTAAPAPVTVGGSTSGRVLGETSIVAGRAVVFIDNQQSGVQSGAIDLSSQDIATEGLNDRVKEYQALSENAEKGKDFPKYTVVGNQIASQAYYRDQSLTEYEFEEGITEIGEFAFARSGLQTASIPDGVTQIGYGAFYHCDQLSDVVIPASVQQIAANAFVGTPWLTTSIKTSSSYPFLVVGDGILLAYDGNDSVVNIPAGVKQIGDECFKGHMGMIAVNIPDTVEKIGNSAFLNCKNLNTVNGGSKIREFGDRAFQNCPLSQITIPATTEKIGIAAFDCAGGTDTVTFEGSMLPVLSYSSLSGRLADSEARNMAFQHCRFAIINDEVQELSQTILEDQTPGFIGAILRENGDIVAENTGLAYEDISGIQVQVLSSKLDATKQAMAEMPGNDGGYLLKIEDSDTASNRISSAYGELYGGTYPSGLYAFEITLSELSKQVPITKLGKQYMTITIPKPAGIKSEFRVVALDQDGQLEAVEHELLSKEDGEYIQFKATHFSPFGIYNTNGYSGQGSVENGKAFISTNKDQTPDTGDHSVHPKWIFALGLLAGSIALFFYKRKTTE